MRTVDDLSSFSELSLASAKLRMVAHIHIADEREKAMQRKKGKKVKALAYTVLLRKNPTVSFFS